jgi:hypothetical protein
MGKAGAKEFFEWLNQNADFRISQLKSLIKSSEGSFDLDFSSESLEPLGSWLSKVLTTRQRTNAEMQELFKGVPDWVRETLRTRNTELTAKSISIAFDVALYFSRVLMHADARITWVMHTRASKLDADRNQLILIGPSQARHNPIRSIQLVCFQISTGKEKPEALGRLFGTWLTSMVGQ